MTWNDMNQEERLSAVTAYIHDGLTGTQMAHKLGTTRSAVLGFCHRNGLKLKSRYVIERSEAKVKRAAVLVPKAPMPTRPPAHNLEGNTAVKEPIKIDAPSKSAKPVPFIEALDRGLCKWPLWTTFEGPDTSMCCGGERIEGRPYCEFHEDLHRGIGTLSERRADEVLERHVEA